jgi:outer membrane lipoprotein-sorting protein
MKTINKAKLLIGIFSAAMAIAAGPSFAGSDATISPSSLLALVRRNYNQETSIESKLTQTIYWSVREKEERKQGSIILAPDDCFRVTVGSETYVSNGKTIWTYNSRANQVVIRNLADVDLAHHPSRLLTAYVEAYPFREKGRTGGTAQLSWSSDTSSAVYTSIRLWVEIKTGTITKCVLTDRNKNLFTYTFANTAFGRKVSKEAFDFVIPKNAQVVDSRK